MKENKDAINENVEFAQDQNARMSDDEFNQELDALMNEDPAEAKKKRKREKKAARKKWSKKRKIITWAVVVVVILLIISKMFSGGKKAPMVMVAPMAKGNVVEKLSVNGPVSGTDSAEVVSNLHTEILEIKVKEGDKVAKGQVLAVLDSSDIQKKVDIAQNAYDSAVTTYKEKNIDAENNYEKAKQDYQTAKDDFDRKNVLFQAGSTSKVELDAARNAMDNARRLLKTFNLKDGKAVADEAYSLDIESKAFDLEQRKKDLDNTQVKAPIDGTVTRVNCKVGRFADKTDSDKPMFTIDNLGVLEMKIDVSEYSIGSVKVGQPVIISADILGGKTVEGKVTNISPTGEIKGAGSTERVIPTTIQILEQNTKLIAGITAKAEIMLAEAKNTWVVPVSALIQMPDGSSSLATVANNKIKLIPVTIGVEGDIQVEVIPKEKDALKEGMEIVQTPVPGIHEGMVVIPMPINRGGKS